MVYNGADATHSPFHSLPNCLLHTAELLSYLEAKTMLTTNEFFTTALVVIVIVVLLLLVVTFMGGRGRR